MYSAYLMCLRSYAAKGRKVLIVKPGGTTTWWTKKNELQEADQEMI